jgi:PH domain
MHKLSRSQTFANLQDAQRAAGKLASNLSLNAHIMSAGFLLKKGTNFPRSWSKRWFQLYGVPHKLEFLSEKNKDETKMIALDADTRLITQPNPNKPLRFSLETKERKIHFEATSAADLEEWTSSLTSVIELAKMNFETVCSPVEDCLHDLQETLVYGHLIYEGVAFLTNADGQAADEAFDAAKKAIADLMDSISDEHHSHAAVMIANYKQCLERARSLIDLLWARIKAQDVIAQYKREALATDVALGKGEHELKTARIHWNNAKKMIDQLRRDKTFRRVQFLNDDVDDGKDVYDINDGDQSGDDDAAKLDPARYIDDVQIFLDDFDQQDIKSDMERRLYQLGNKRRPSIVKSNTAALDRALYKLEQKIQLASVPYRGTTFFTEKKMDAVIVAMEEFRQVFEQFHKLYGMDPQMKSLVDKYEAAGSECEQQVEDVSERSRVHELINDINKLFAHTSLLTGGRNYLSASKMWEKLENAIESLTSIRGRAFKMMEERKAEKEAKIRELTTPSTIEEEDDAPEEDEPDMNAQAAAAAAAAFAASQSGSDEIDPSNIDAVAAAAAAAMAASPNTRGRRDRRGGPPPAASADTHSGVTPKRMRDRPKSAASFIISSSTSHASPSYVPVFVQDINTFLQIFGPKLNDLEGKIKAICPDPQPNEDIPDDE